MLRDYQQRSIDQLYDWMRKNGGNPCLQLPTGSGKSHIVAALCKDALQNWPDTRILMLTHQKELIEQNAEKLRQVWPGAPMGIYSASVGKKQAGEPITFAGIQSISKKSYLIGHIDLVIVDECHLINHKQEGGYRTLIQELKEKYNPGLRVIGLTATPYRLGHGLITEKPAIFDAILEPAPIEELVYKGYLAPLRSKITDMKLSTDGVHKRGGEFIERELQQAVDQEAYNIDAVDEVVSLAGNRKAWLFFCTGVKHAEHIKDLLNDRGVTAECITGDTPKSERERILLEYKQGKIKALTNANVLTTGFDYPDIDLIAMLRPTMSASLYVQMAGRGMRPKSHTDHCLVLDFAGVVETHGPITAVQPPKKKGDKPGDAPVKTCDQCGELVHASARECPDCGFLFPLPDPKKLHLRNDDIMGSGSEEMELKSWNWRKHISRNSGKEMLAVSYYGKDLSAPTVTEYFTIAHDGYAGQRAMQNLAIIATNCGASEAMRENDMENIAKIFNDSPAPEVIEYKKDGKFFRVLHRSWSYAETA